MVADPVGDYGLTFFVTDSGGAIFLAVSEQMLDKNHSWLGSTIQYSRQPDLETKFSPIMNEIATWLHGHGYYGPANADILESAVVNGSRERRFDIVDLNVRTSGSLCLPLLRGHFTSRGLDCASSFSVTVQATRDNFVERWREDFELGRMCILALYTDTHSGSSIADVAVGAVDEVRLSEVSDLVRSATDDVTFY